MRPEIQTVSGRAFSFVDIRPESINIKDIAHALSNICRYTGHSPFFYSVAEHSIRVALEVPRLCRMEALLHDASEAYIADISSPAKQLPEFDGYRALEDRIQQAVFKRFGVKQTAGSKTIVKTADTMLLAVEGYEFYKDNYIGNWGELIDHGRVLAEGSMKGKFAMHYDPYKARELFLQTFEDFGGKVC